MSIRRRSKRLRICCPLLYEPMGALAIFLRRMPIGMQTCGLATEVMAPIMHPFRPKSDQLDLFGPSDDNRSSDTPRWRSLPARKRQRATCLMTRMLLDHRGNRAEVAETGAGEERSDV